MNSKESVFLPEADIIEFERAGRGRSYGSNQQMYKTIWQRKSGCGPSAAANMFLYAAWSARHGEINSVLCNPRCIPLTEDVMLKLMQRVWEFITPRLGGVNRTDIFTRGAHEYAKSKGLELSIYSLDVGAKNNSSIGSYDEFKNFIFSGLEKGCPVAFLNLCSGEVQNLDPWHWVTIMGCYEKQDICFATIYDEGNKKEINMSLWFETNKKGGGLVYFDPAKTKKIQEALPARGKTEYNEPQR